MSLTPVCPLSILSLLHSVQLLLPLQPRIKLSTLHAWLLSNASVECLSPPLCKKGGEETVEKGGKGSPNEQLSDVQYVSWYLGVDADACGFCR